jgi:outer membrane protein assembly factor BamB
MLDFLNHIVFVGIKGTVLALHRHSGDELWRTELKGSDFVNLVLDGPDLFATSRGEIYCLDPATGQIRWNNPLRGLGCNLVSIASANPANLPAIAQYLQNQQAAAAYAGSAT